MPNGSFAIGEHDFLLNGEPFRILSGAIHYFRVHPEQWADRIRSAKLMGLNTVETYVAWNAHAPRRGEFNTEDGLDLSRFLDLVAAEGMHAIVRPGPYICAEWDNGGLPAWLFREPGMELRRNNGPYMSAVSEYLGQVLPIVAQHQISNGGPVILVQIENEYGAYGNDKDYLASLVEITRGHGITVPLTTVDQPSGTMLDDGSLPTLHKTASFGSNSVERLAVLRANQPTGPLMCSEFWIGWFDHWGEHHHTTSAGVAAAELDALLSAGASVNFYMFHGGTNFGFTNGANHKGRYQSHVTSYDYDAPLDEAGHPTEKFHAFREVIAKYAAVPPGTPAPAPATPEFTVALTSRFSLADVRELFGTWRPAGNDGSPATLDQLGQDRGYCYYRASLPSGGILRIGEIRDRAIVLVDGQPVGVLERDRNDRSLHVPAGQILELLVEDCGRVNYGPKLGEAKGLIGPVTVGGQEIGGWEALPLDLDALTAGRLGVDIFKAELEPTASDEPADPSLSVATFDLDKATDLHLDTSAWGKGSVWVNGFNLGRYWSRGPQHTLYVPAGQLRSGKNELVVLETSAFADPRAVFVAGPKLGHVEA